MGSPSGTSWTSSHNIRSAIEKSRGSSEKSSSSKSSSIKNSGTQNEDKSSSKGGNSFFEDFLQRTAQKSAARTSLTGRTLTGGNNQTTNAGLTEAASAKAQAAVEDVKASEGQGSGLQLGQWDPDDLVNRNLTGDNRPVQSSTAEAQADAIAKSSSIQDAKEKVDALTSQDKTYWSDWDWMNYEKARQDLRSLTDPQKQVTDWNGRNQLIRELEEIDQNSGWVTDERTANETASRRANIVRALETGDALYGNGLQSYSDVDRGRQILTGSSKNYAAGMLNALGTAEAMGYEGVDTNPYAGWATDEISRANIRFEHDEDQMADYQFLRTGSEKLEETADRIGESAARDLESAKAGLNGLGVAGVDIATNVIQMGYDAALGRVFGGGLLPMFIRSMGSAAQEARQEGADVMQQWRYGVAAGSIETATEKLGNGMSSVLSKVYGKGLADEATEEIIRRVAKSDFGRSFLRFLSGGAEEGLEEVVSDLLSPLAQKLYKDDRIGELYRNLDPKEIGYDFLIGAAIGWMGSAVGVTTGENREQNAILRAEDRIRAKIGEGMTRDEAMTSIIAEDILKEIENRNEAGQAEESTSVDTNPEDHSEAEQRVVDEYQAAADPALTRYIERILESGAEGAGRFDLNPVSDRAAEDILRITGVDVKGNATQIEPRMVEHIWKDHGENGQADQSMRDVNDIARVQYVLDHYDDATDGGSSSAYVTMKPNGKHGLAKTVVFSKAVNGTYYVVETVPDTKARTVYIVSTYMQNNKPGAVHSANAAETTTRVTSETQATTPTGTFNVPQATENSNTKYSGLRLGAQQEGAGNETRQGVTAQEEPGILGPQEAQQGPGEAPAGAGAAGIVRADADAGTAAAVSGEQAAADGSGGRYSDGRAGGEAGRLDRNAGTGSGVAGADGQRRNAAGQSLGDAVRESGVTPVSSKAFGLDNGTDRACVYRVPEEMLPENLRNRIHGIEAETGCSLEFFAGPLEVMGVDGYVHKTNGFFDPTGRRICVRVDHEIYEAWQILAHEEFHALAERDPWLVARIRDRIVEQYGRSELREILKGYILRRRGISNIESGSMSVFSEEAKGMLEEIFADANGMMNAFGLGAQQFFMPVLRELNSTSMSPQTQGGSRSSRGPPRYSDTETAGSAYDDNNKPIRIEDVHALRSINGGNRISVNQFSSEDLQKAQKWANRYYQQTGVKSPFFRAWFGEWRANDKTPLLVADVSEIDLSTEGLKKAFSSLKGEFENRDTKRGSGKGWIVRVSNEGLKNTEGHAGKNLQSVQGLSGLQTMIENAVLLDTELHEHHSNNSKTPAGDRIAFDHRLYSLGKKQDGSLGLYRITVEDLFQGGRIQNDYRFHNLKYIEKVADLPGRLTDGNQARRAESPNSGATTTVSSAAAPPGSLTTSRTDAADSANSEGTATVTSVADLPRRLTDGNQARRAESENLEESTTEYTVADLYQFVKQYDQEFNVPQREAHPDMLDEDGKPRVFYHGTEEDFTVFDRSKGRSTMDIQGMFFSPWEIEAEGYGSKVGAYYLALQNPAPEGMGYKALNRFKGQNHAGIKAREYLESLGYDGVVNYDEVIAFYPEQIKSATDNIGTFDRSNPDIRFSYTDDEDLSLARENTPEYNEAIAPSLEEHYWPENFPQTVFNTNLPGLKYDRALHDAAKNGDRNAADQIVRRVIKPDRVRQLAETYPDAMVVPVWNSDTEAGNMLPYAYAEELANYGLTIDDKIIQIQKGGHTDTDGIHRLMSHSVFEGEVSPGQSYILVDDVQTFGGTLNDLRMYIESKGGKVVAVTTLAVGRNGSYLAARPETVQAIYDRHGEERINNLLRKAGIAYDAASLTDRQARYIRDVDYDTLRDRIREKASPGEYQGGAPDRGRAESQRAGGEGSAEQRLKFSFDDEEDLTLPGESAAQSPALRQAIGLVRQGALPSEVYNETGLVKMANGNLIDPDSGEIIWRNDNGFEGSREEVYPGRETEGTAETEVPEYDGRGIAGRSGKRLPGRRSWRSLSGDRRKAITDTVTRHVREHSTPDLRRLRVRYTDAAFAEEVYRRYLQDRTAYETDELIELIPDAELLYDAIDRTVNKGDSEQKFSVSEEILPGARYGSSDVTFNDTTEVPFRWAVVPLGSLTVSNDVYGNINPNYPQELQPRDRTRADSLNQTQNMANSLIPRKLEESADIQNGAPVIRGDGVVISGNGRSIAMMMAYDRGKADGYVEYLRQNAGKWGLDPESIPEDRPVLVRVAEDGQDWTQLARDANVSTIAGRSASEQARTDARNLERHPEVLEKLITDEDGNLNTPANREFISDFIQSVIPENERNEMHTSDGLLTQDGLVRVQRAIFEMAYGDASLLERLSERLDNDMKNVTNALLAAAPGVVSYENGVTNGTRYDIGLRDRVLEAIRIYTEARQNGETVALRTANLGLDEAANEKSVYVARFIEMNKASGRQLRIMLNALSETADELGDPNQVDFFTDEEENKTFDQVLEGAISKYEKASGRQLPRPERWGSGTLEEVGETAGLRGSELRDYYLSEPGGQHAGADAGRGELRGEEPGGSLREGPAEGTAENPGSERDGSLILGEAESIQDSGATGILDQGSGESLPSEESTGETPAEPGRLTVGAASEEPSEGARRILEEKRREDRQTEQGRKKTVSRNRRIPDYNREPEGSGKSFREIAGEIRARAAEERARRLERVSKEKFFGTEALSKLGVKIEGALGNYHGTRQLREIERAAKELKREIRKQEKLLNATEKEKQLALGIAAGIYSTEDLGLNVNRAKVEALADYYELERTINDDLLMQRRRDINLQLDEEIQAMLPDDPGYKIPPMFVLNHRTPERLCRNIWGDEKGKEVYEYAFRPVAVNEAEKIRWVKKQFDDVREIEGKDGTKSELTRDEVMLAQQVLEGRAAAELVAGMELEDGRDRIESVAQNILNGDDASASAQEFGLTDKERGIAEQYARWLQTKAILDSGEFDATKIDNAVEIYKEKYNLMYDAINDFLVAHGYKPIGFIRGYAPHMQMQEDLNVFAGYLRSLGINEDVTRLPTNIAGRTAGLKPNKRWNPYFLQRSGDVTDFDIAKGFQSYITYLSDVLYHTDDTMRIRAMSRHYRELFAPENIKENLSWARHMNSLAPDVKREQLQQRGILNRDAAISEEEVNDTFDKWIQEQFDSIENTTKYSDLVMYLDNYANILAGKQSMSDRGGEYDWGRESLTRANRIITAFARTQVAGNLSSAFSQLSQIPMIQAELGPKYVLQAVRDFASGTLRKGGFAQQSDHLTERAGSGALVTDKLDMVMDKMFSPLRVIDGFTAAIAVRAKYLQQIEQGKSHAEAMKEADAYAKRVQGSRAKGSKPLAFHSKKVVNQMLHLFQLELFNSWEHVSQDIPADFREIEREHGKATAVKALARVIVSYLLTAFLLNRVTEETYGGTPAPFDLLGITSNFIASGYGLTTNRYLETAIDNVLEKATEQRLFGTDPEKMREEFKWSDALSGGWYEAGSDIPYLRNIMGLMGLGDQSLPLPLMGLGDELKYLFRDAKSDLEAGKLSGQTGMDLLRIMNQLIPGGRQLTKTEEGLQVMTQGGRYVNGKLYYPVDNSFGNWVKAILFGRSALEEGNAFYAGDDKALSLGATELYQMLTGQGSAEQREAYDALQTARNLSDDQTEWLRSFADGGGDSWAAWQTMQEYKAVNADDTLGSYEKGRQTRAVITGAALTDEERLALYRVMDKNNASRADKLETIMESGLSWAEAVRAYDAYAEIEAREDVSKKEQAEAWASWVNHQNFTDGQKDTIREQIKFWGSYAIEDTTVDSLTESGLSPDSADLIAELLGGLEPIGDRDHVTDLQKYQAIVSSGLSEDEQWRAIIGITPESYTSTLDKITILQDMGVSPEVWTQSKQAMYDADDAGNDNGSTDQKEAKAALDGMKIPDEQKAILWQLTNKSWSWKNNPYDKDVGQEVYALLHDGDTGNTKTTKKKSGGRGGGRRGGGGKKTAALEVGAAFDSGHSGMFDSVLLGWKRKKYSRAQILAMVRAGLLTQEEADEILATLQETDDTESAAGTDGSLTLGEAEG